MAKATKATPTLETISLSTVSVAPSDIKHPRMLVIEFLGDAPKFKYLGDWSVRHLLTVKRCISREFKIYRRDIIRNSNITNKET